MEFFMATAGRTYNVTANGRVRASQTRSGTSKPRLRLSLTANAARRRTMGGSGG